MKNYHFINTNKIKMIYGVVTTNHYSIIIFPGTSLAERVMYKQSGSAEEDFFY